MSDPDDTMKMILSMLEKIIELQTMMVDRLEEIGRKADLGERAYQYTRPSGL